VVATTHEPLGQLRDLLEQILGDAIASHAVHPDIDPRLHAELILKLLLDPRDPTTVPGRTAAAARDQLVGFVLRGLTATASAPGRGPATARSPRR
jgi:hypothetical protein